jgi:hypothetical protein
MMGMLMFLNEAFVLMWLACERKRGIERKKERKNLAKISKVIFPT